MDCLAELRGESPGIIAVRRQIARLLHGHPDARRLPPILIQGETGTGKGLLARAIHRESPRQGGGPFVDVNCAAIPETLLEAEMFGFERGAFTDARQSKPGLFHAAHRGTLFLDEIGLLSERLQAKLLKVVEERAVRRLGGVSSEPTDAWIITASNQDLLAATHAGRFREDLYHRLAVFTICLPPLRQRGRDILLLAQHFLDSACSGYGLPRKALARDAEAALLAHQWPGNVRELANVLERVALLSDGPLVTADGLGLADVPPAAHDAGGAELSGSLDDALRDHLLAELEATDWNISRAAERLRVTRNTVRARMDKYGLRPPLPGQRGRRPDKPRAVSDASAPGTGAPSHVGPRWESQGLTILRATLVPRCSPDEPVESARPLERLIQTVQSFGGSVETLDPRSILAIFGLRTVEDWSRRAAASAMASQLALRREEDNRFAVKAAIHFGHFLVGKIGGVAAMEEDGKREVSRTLEVLLRHAEPDTIVMSEPVARLLERRFTVVPANDVGETSGPAYRLAGSQASTFAIEGRVPTFVGRRDELGLLRSKYLLARRGRGEVVGIVGEAGIGKSRLLWEFRSGIREDPVIYLEGRCASYGSAVPYLPLLDVIRAYCGITDADGPAAMADRIRSAMLRVDMSPADAVPYVLQLLGLKERDDRLGMLGPATTRARTFDALQQMLLRAGRQQPLILVIEDLHWSDKTSQEFLASLVESMSGAPLLLVVTYRPGYRLPWMDKSYATQIALEPLSPEDSLDVVNGVVQREPLPGALAEAILRRAEGNPFFLEELTRAVVEQSAGAQVLSVPDTIQGVLMARLDRLLGDTKQVLQNASVLGRTFSSRLLGAIGKAPGGLDPHLHELERLEFIHKQPGAGEGRYVFKHALTHEVVYDSLPIHHRKALHEAAGRAVEALYTERLDEHDELLAYHYGRSANLEKALEYLERANRKAGKAYAMEEAKAYFDEAMRVLDGMPGAMRSRFQAATARGLGPFVGRDLEMAQLEQALERAAQGHGQVVAVVGEAGVGKSRLYWEFIRSHRTRDWLVLQSGSASYGRATAYLPVISLLKHYFHIEEGAPARKIRETVAGKVLALERALEPAVVPLLALLEVNVEASGWERLEPSQRRQRTQDVLRRLLLRESQVQHLVLVFEDLHWIDAETQAFLDGMVESLPTARILLLVNYRPEYRHGWSGKTYVRELRIDPLPPASAEELLRSVLGSAPDLEPLKRLLIERAEGNPLFLEESVRALVETQGVVGERGAYRLGRPPETRHVPATVQTILGARIDRLDPDDKRLLQTAAVIGKDVPLALLEIVAELPDEALRAGLARLQGAEFLYEAALFPERKYTFKHALTHEVAYASLLPARRRALHARIVEAMERLYADRLAEHVERLGYHALRAETWDKALQYLREAGEKALARSAHREAAANLEHALEANEKLPPTKQQGLDGIDLRTALRIALFPLADRGKILRYLREAESLAEGIGDQARLGRILTFITGEVWLNAGYTEALALAERATAIGHALGDTVIQAFAHYRAGQVFHDLGEYRKATTMQQESLALLGQPQRLSLLEQQWRQATWLCMSPSELGEFDKQRLSLLERQWRQATWLCMSLSELGEFDQAARYGEDILRLAEAGNAYSPLTHLTMALGRLWLRRGEIERAAAISERGRDVAQTQGFRLLQYHNAAALGYALGLAGRRAEGEALLREALNGTEAGFGRFARGLFMTWLAEIELMAGEGRRAKDHGDEALQIARDRGERGNEAWALRLLAEIAAHVQDADPVAATHNYQSALALASELGMRPLVAHCHLGLGKLYQRTVKPEQAREHLATVTAMYREMEMRLWLEQAEAEMNDLKS